MKKVTIYLLGLGLMLALPQVLTAKGNPHGGGDGAIPGHISMDVAGAVLADQDCDTNLGADTTIYTCNKAGTASNPHKIMLGNFFMRDGDDWRTYPTGASAEHCFGVGYLDVTMQVILNKDSSAETVMRFWGFKKDGVTEILYVLRVNDLNGWSGDFPPPLDAPTTMGGSESSEVSWNLDTSKHSVAGDACVDSGVFPGGDDYIGVVFTRDW